MLRMRTYQSRRDARNAEEFAMRAINFTKGALLVAALTFAASSVCAVMLFASRMIWQFAIN